MQFLPGSEANHELAEASIGGGMRQPSQCGPSSGNHPNIRTSRPLAPVLRLVGQEARKRVIELRCPVTVPREIGTLNRRDDETTNKKEQTDVG